MCFFPPIIVILLVVVHENLAQVGPIDNACSQLWRYHFRLLRIGHCHYNPDVLSSTPTMAARHKFPVETHTVTTSDGYILTIFRIRSADSTKNSADKPPVFMQHGIAVNSEYFTAIGERSHAFHLANAGYDVWLGNARGTVYSKNHVNISSEDPRFWNFNLDTLAAKDLRESLRYVGSVTGKAGSISYIGHSMGATIGFMYAAAFPEESQRTLDKIITLGPVVYLNDTDASSLPALKTFSRAFGPTLLRVLDLLRINAVFYPEKTLQGLIVEVCGTVPFVCRGVIHVLFGKTDRFAAEDLLLHFGHWIQAVSTGQVKQFLQFLQTGEFKKFDYGATKNTQVYGQPTPPFYDLSQVQLPVYLFYGGTDAFVTTDAVQRIYKQLGSAKKNLTQIPLHDSKAPFNHIDFIYSKDIEQDLYPPLLSALNEN